MTKGAESDLIFGAEKLIRILRSIDDRFRPKLIGVVAPHR